jgi:DNA repair protein RecN (Recombination protein N)
MLTHLKIRGYAIIDALELEFGAGLTVVTGETGAGKSIVVDALGLLLGDRAESGVVRTGAERAELEAEFDLSALPHIAAWLRDRDFDEPTTDGSQLVLRRIVGADGRSRASVNGRAAPLGTLAELGELLVDLHGQHEHQSLGRRDAQLAVLDHYGRHGEQLGAVAARFSALRKLRSERDALAAAHADREARLDLLRFQSGELDGVAPVAGEHAALEAERSRYANLGRLVEGGRRALDVAYDADEANAYRALSAAIADLAPLAEIDAQLAPTLEALRGAQLALQEGATDLRRWLDGLELDPARRDEVEARLAELTRLARKHRVGVEELAALRERLHAELATLQRSDARLTELDAALSTAQREFETVALALRDRRRSAAAALGKELSAALRELGMPGGRFALELAELGLDAASARGLDAVEFMVSVNPGQPLRPLGKVASGGELARIGLAVQAIAAGANGIPTLVFDEVDSGVGGGVAEIVGRRLRALATSKSGDGRQVLCVTHLPQVAAQGHAQLRVTKSVVKGATRTAVEALDEKQRVEELARMLGGVEITATTRKHAREMLERADAVLKSG